MKSNIKFITDTVEIPETLKPGQKYEVRFDFEGDGSEIVHIAPGCGCTANCRVEGNQVVADYTDMTSSSVNSGIYDFAKTLRVFLKDDQELWNTDETSYKKLNLQKDNRVLTFKGKVLVK